MLKNQISTKNPLTCYQQDIYPINNKHTLNHNMIKQQKQIKQISTILGINTRSHSLSRLQLNNQTQQRKGNSKIKQISQLINTHNNNCNTKRQDKNFCSTKCISLNALSQNILKNDKKKKLQVSLSKQKVQNRERSASQKSGNKGTKLKVSLNDNFNNNKQKIDPIRKIKDFQITNQQKQQVNKIRTARLIKNLQNFPSMNRCPNKQIKPNYMEVQYQSNPHPHSLAQNYQINKQQKKKVTSTINISISLNNGECGMFERRKIRLNRNR